jgi:cGMP-dependent protein kinase
MKGPILDYVKDRINLQNTQVTLSELLDLKVIGRGGCGVVRMVQSQKTAVRYALKCVPKREVVERGQQDALAQERRILGQLDHPFIIKFVRSFATPTRVYFLQELVTGGELLDVLDTLGLLSQPQAQFYTGSLVLALEFLHRRRIAYLDLKGENVLLDRSGYVKLIDMGLAEHVRGYLYEAKGTPWFMAPEVILGRGYTTSADLWSLGVCLYEFMMGGLPFGAAPGSHVEYCDVLVQVLEKELDFPEELPNRCEEAERLIAGLLTRDPRARLGSGPSGHSAIRDHEFFADFSWDDLLGRQLTPPYVPNEEIYAEDRSVDVSISRSSFASSNASQSRPVSAEELKKRMSSVHSIWDTDTDSPRSRQGREDEESRLVQDVDAEEDRRSGDAGWEDPKPGWDAEF